MSAVPHSFMGKTLTASASSISEAPLTLATTPTLMPATLCYLASARRAELPQGDVRDLHILRCGSRRRRILASSDGGTFMITSVLTVARPLACKLPS